MRVAGTPMLAAGLLTLLGAAAPADAPGNRDEAFFQLGLVVDEALAALPSPPATPAEKAAARAWKSVGKAVDRAYAKKDAYLYARTADAVDRTLSEAFPEDPAVAGTLDGLLASMIGFGHADIAVRETELLRFPDGEAEDALKAALDAAGSLLEDAAAAPDRRTGSGLCLDAYGALRAYRKAYAKALVRSVGRKGMAATVAGFPLAAGGARGEIVVSPEGQPRSFTVTATRKAGPIRETLSVSVDLRDQFGPVFLVPAVYTIGGGLQVEVAWTRSDDSGLLQSVTGTEGTVTIVSVDPKRRKAAGYFQCTGPDLFLVPTAIAGGTFNAAGLAILDEAP